MQNTITPPQIILAHITISLSRQGGDLQEFSYNMNIVLSCVQNSILGYKVLRFDLANVNKQRALMQASLYI
jgi:hypothetical protein